MRARVIFAVVYLFLAPSPAGGSASEPSSAEVVEHQAVPAATEVIPDYTEYDQFMADLWLKKYSDQPLEKRLIRSIFRSRIPEGGKEPRWERCGQVVAKEDYVEEARTWVRIFLHDLEGAEVQYGVKIPVWGAWSVIANESGFNECSLDFYSRLWASETSEKILTTETWHGRTVTRKILQPLVKRFELTYSRDDVWRIIKSQGFQTATVWAKDPKKPGEMKLVRIMGKFDGGPMQMRASSKKIVREDFEDMMSLNGIQNGLMEMARRAVAWQTRFREKTPHPRPWQLWPGGNGLTVKATSYDTKIISVARWLGATRKEMDPKVMAPVYPDVGQ